MTTLSVTVTAEAGARTQADADIAVDHGASASRLDAVVRRRVALAVGAQLRAIETGLAAQVDSPVALAREMGRYAAGGKRLRPLLLLLAARLAGYRGPRAVRLGCVVELLHTATLIHDDVVDRATLRRGRPSANARWGDDASILFGDHLYAKSLALMLRDGDPEVMATLARATVSMTEAEVLQLECKRKGTLTEDDYLRIIAQKTASFMSACCRIGALLGGVEGERLNGLTRYGHSLGIAFQISDDALDFLPDGERLGKRVGADLGEGKLTLPLFIMLRRAGPATREHVRKLLDGGPPSPEAIAEVRRLVGSHGGVEAAIARAEGYARRAKDALRCFEDSEDRKTLFLIADFAVARDH